MAVQNCTAHRWAFAQVDREIIARGILQAAKTGERDVNKLCERAILGLTAVDYRQDGA